MALWAKALKYGDGWSPTALSSLWSPTALPPLWSTTALPPLWSPTAPPQLLSLGMTAMPDVLASFCFVWRRTPFLHFSERPSAWPLVPVEIRSLVGEGIWLYRQIDDWDIPPNDPLVPAI